MQIYDNKRRFDRYLVIINGNAYRMSNNPDHVYGMNQWAGPANKRIIRRAGKQVVFEDLNHKVQEAIRIREYAP